MQNRLSEDEVIWQNETEDEFVNSSILFYKADDLRYLENNKPEAEKTYRAAMNATGDYGVYFHLAQGQIYSMLGNIEYALTEFEIAAQINDMIDAVYINLGITYRKIAGQLRSFNLENNALAMTEESINALKHAIEINPDNSQTWSLLAATYLKNNEEIDNAEKCIKRAYELNPQSYLALTNLATLRQKQKNIPEARRFAIASIEQNPNQFFVYGMLGSRLKAESLEPKPKDAMTWLEKGLLLEPDNSYLLSELAKAYKEIQLFDESLHYFDKAINTDKEGTQKFGFLANRGEAFRLVGKLQEAEDDLRAALEINSKYSFALISLVKVLKSLSHYEEAFELAKKINKTDYAHKNLKLYTELEQLFKADKDQSETITKKLKDDSASPRSKQTKDEAAKALTLYSKNADAFGIYGRCCFAEGNLKEAKKYIERALVLDCNKYFYRRHLGQIYEKLGELKNAEREYSKFLLRVPKDNDCIKSLQRVQNLILSEERTKAREAVGSEIVFLNNKTGREEHHLIETIRSFLEDRMRDWNLPIKEIIDQIGDDPVFIIAKTGVGKTVTVPTKILLGLCDRLLNTGVGFTKGYPQVYVVEPRIPICTMTMAEMNEGYQNYLAYKMLEYPDFIIYVQSEGVNDVKSNQSRIVARVIELAYKYVSKGKAPYNPRHYNLYGCITSATGKINPDAPILFVTTGIMESLTFTGTGLNPDYNRIIIDEAHVTIEANPGIELGIALARKQGIKIDYMSATVAPCTLEVDLGVRVVYAEAPRFCIQLTNLKTTVEESIVNLVEHCLITPSENYFPNPDDYDDPKEKEDACSIRRHLLSPDDFLENGRKYPGLANRPQGMLVIVNSHQSENSDTHRIADLICKAHFNRGKTLVHTLRLASPIVRDPSQKLAFDRLIRKIESDNGRYVIVATNVVEMGLTFSSLDYIITMDSEFDTEFVDGSQMIRKVELGVNALYQRIGRVGRLRPGMAFIAKDFGAWYSELDNRTLAAGLDVTAIRYPMAKGSFLKLALYSFREKIPECKLLETIASLNLPSRIHENTELWARFIAERERLVKIGIAEQDYLTPEGESALGFIGLDDMDFANLLARVIEKYGINSDLAVVFTVLAASAEIGFADLMDKRFYLANPKQLSAMEIIHEQAVGIPVDEVHKLIKELESHPNELYEALKSAGVDDILSNNICSFLQSGYLLVNREATQQEASIQQPEETTQDEIGELLSEDIEEPEVVIDEYDIELSDEVKLFVEFSTNDTIAFERAVVSLSDQSDLINIYRIYRYFYNNYFSHLKNDSMTLLEASELRSSLEDEANKLQISIRGLFDLNKVFNQLIKHVGIRLLKQDIRNNKNKISKEETQILIEAIVQDLLFERDGNDDRFKLCLKYYDIMEHRGNFRQSDCDMIVSELKTSGFRVTREEVKELWLLIIKEAKKRYLLEVKKYILIESKEVLPILSKGLERDLLSIVKEFGYHRRLNLNRTSNGFTTIVRDQFNNEIEVTLPEENNPLGLSLNDKDYISIYAKLTPTLVIKNSKNNASNESVEQAEKNFKISHVTLL